MRWGRIDHTREVRFKEDGSVETIGFFIWLDDGVIFKNATCKLVKKSGKIEPNQSQRRYTL